jgi:modification methylase
MVAALKNGRSSIGVEIDGEYCKMAASRLLNENTSLFGKAQLQIDLKPASAVESAAAVHERPVAYKTRIQKK